MSLFNKISATSAEVQGWCHVCFGSVLHYTIATLDLSHFGERSIEGRNVLSHSLGLNQDLGTFFVVNISLRRCQHSLSHPDA